MEDGFIRSRGLGSDFVGALSVTLDDLGVYYDATRPSRLEALIEQGGFSPALLARAARLRAADRFGGPAANTTCPPRPAPSTPGPATASAS